VVFRVVLGLPLAAAFAVLNAMWYELMDDEATRRRILERTSKLPE
jgi:cyd operon protein YbgT